MPYTVYSDFDTEQHKKTFIHYLEVVIDENGKIMYAVPSHQEKLISIACKKLNVTREKLNVMCCKQKEYFYFMDWLCKMSGACAVWENFIQCDKLTEQQIRALQMLKENGLYLGWNTRGGVDSMLEFYNQLQPKARKDHVCEFCEQKIHKGETYSYETGKYGGDMFVRKLCLTCYNILNGFCRDSGEEEFDWWCVTDCLRDLYCCDCEHGIGENDDCEMQPQNCPLIRKKFEPKEDTQNANPAN